MTDVDSTFIGAGTVAGLELWRIEKLAPVRVPEVNDQPKANKCMTAEVETSACIGTKWRLQLRWCHQNRNIGCIR